MKLSELLFEDIETSGIYEPEQDNRVHKLKDTRKPKLTLKHLNKLRKYKEFKKQELYNKLKTIAIVYKTPEEGGGDVEQDLGF